MSGGAGYEWRPYRKGDPLPPNAVLAGSTSTDGANFVCRVHNEGGKVNMEGTKINNFWCHKGGQSQQGDLLCIMEGHQASWEHRKKGDQLPDGAVYVGNNSSDGENYACRNGAAAGKLTLNGGRVNNFWIHGNWFAKDDGEVCVVREKPGHHGHHEHHGQPDQPGWNPNADCEGTRAEERMRWLIDNQRLSQWDAQAKIMSEFPRAFHHEHAHGSGGHWNGYVICDGTPAEERMRWLMDNQGFSMHDAQAQVMKEFPHAFGDGSGSHWNGYAICDGTPAEERMRWLMDNQGLSMHDAQAQVMKEFPQHFH